MTFIRLLVVGLMSALCCCAKQKPTPPLPLRVLFIGNSYTFCNDLPGIVAQLAATNGYAIVCDSLTRGGATFQDHCERFGALDRIASGAWDVVVLQNQSYEPIENLSNMFVHGSRLCHAAAQAGARTVLLLTWAYAGPRGSNAAVAAGVPAMQERLNAAYYQLAHEMGADVAPAGRAFEAVRTAHPDWRLHMPDNSHPAPPGSYLAGLALYSTLFKQPARVVPTTLPPLPGTRAPAKHARGITVSLTQAQAFARSAWACVTNDVTRRYVAMHPLAATTQVLAFPDLPLTLAARADKTNCVPTAALFYPRNYSATGQFPVLIFLNGGKGGNGSVPAAARELCRERDFVCMNLPLFKRTLAPLHKNKKNEWSRLFIRDRDSDVIWRAYAVMLARLFSAADNFDRRNVFFGGFSNGGHTTAVLLNRSAMEITNYTHKFLFVEGGSAWTNAAPLAGCGRALVLQGGSYKQNWLEPMFRNATNCGVQAEFMLMPGTGHGFSPAGIRGARTWLYRNLE